MSYLSSLSTLLDSAKLSVYLGPASALIHDLPVDELLEQVFYRDLRHYPNMHGDKIAYTLDLVLVEGLGFDIPNTGFRLELNADPSLNNATVIPISLSYQLPILRYLDQFEPDQLGQSPAEYYQLLLSITRASPTINGRHFV